jgi:regulator of sigma E protease
MTQVLGFLATLPDLALVVLGFGFIIFVHELGHFLAAKWAGIRVLAFAIGFGKPIVSFRKGLGLRFGRSTEAEYKALRDSEKSGGPAPAATISPTEYRLNWLPLGGYVKMLGQDDLDPLATSGEPDSYQSTKPWKRMVVISAGVVMNIILAAILFVFVFMQGLKTEPAEVGGVFPGSPAATAVALNAAELGITRPGLQAGDVVKLVNGREPEEFTDLVLAAAMSRRGEAVHLLVDRPGVGEPLRFEIIPREGGQRLLEMGVFPAASATLKSIPRGTPDGIVRQVRASLDRVGLRGVEPGMRLVSVDGRPAQDAAALQIAARDSGGRPLNLEFTDGKARVLATVRPQAELEEAELTLPSGMEVTVDHLLGLTPVMRVAPEAEPVQGLRGGDIFARIGSVRFPSIADGMAEIHAHKGRSIEISVLRDTGAGLQLVELSPPPQVSREGHGRVGFPAADTGDVSTILALPPRGMGQAALPGSELVARPGSRIVSVAGKPVASFTELRTVLLEAADPAREQGLSVSVPVQIELPSWSTSGAAPTVETVAWALSPADLERVRGLGWSSPVGPFDFEPKEFVLQAKGPVDALRMGIAKTHRVMMMTYLTFARLFEGTVKVEHLKGPVGIAQMGTKVAERGLIWLLFFMALISVNLAVINFLPLPIVDGGQFIFLVLEQIRGRPVSPQIQNVTTMIGLLLIGTMFIIVTFNDIVNLFG